jgi:hypothetical protein
MRDVDHSLIGEGRSVLFAGSKNERCSGAHIVACLFGKTPALMRILSVVFLNPYKNAFK